MLKDPRWPSAYQTVPGMSLSVKKRLEEAMIRPAAGFLQVELTNNIAQAASDVGKYVNTAKTTTQLLSSLVVMCMILRILRLQGINRHVVTTCCQNQSVSIEQPRSVRV